MNAMLAQLGRQLLAAADPSLLDAPLDRLGPRVRDEEARALLSALYEQGEGRTLREVLVEGRLARWVEETCTPREEEALLAELRRWLGFGSSGSDDPARLAKLEPVPDDADALIAWARRYDVLDELSRPACEVVSAELSPDLTLLACVLGHVEGRTRGRSLLASYGVRDRARDYLRGEAAAHAGLKAREALWRAPLAARDLRTLVERLRALVADTAPSSLASLRFVPARPVTVDVTTGVCQGHVRGGDGDAPIHVALFLSGYEARALVGTCDRCRRKPCLHVRALAGRLLDACLAPDDRLHAPLKEFVAVPSWKRFLVALDAGAEPAKAPRMERLAFVVRLSGERASVGVLVQKRCADGRYSQGKLSVPQKLLRSQSHRDDDRAALEALSAASRTLNAQFVPADMTVWRSLVEHPHVLLEGSDEPVRVVEHTVDVALVEQPGGLLPRVSLAGASLAPGERKHEQTYLLRYDRATSTLAVATLTPALRRLLAALGHFHGVLPPESYGALAPFLASLRQVARVVTPKALLGREQPPPKKLLLRIEPGLDEGIDVGLTMRALPLGALWPPGQGPELVHGLKDGVAVYARRDLAWERETATKIIEQLKLTEHLRIDGFTYRIEARQPALEVLSAAARLCDLLDIEWAERAKRFDITGTVRTSDLKVELFKKGQWFSLEGGANNAAAELAIGRLLEAARRGERFVPVAGSSYVEIEANLFARLRAAQFGVADLPRVPALSTAAAPYWLDKLGDVSEAGDGETARWLERLRTRVDAEPEVSHDALEHLRNYQREGVRFLLERARWAPGVCLADEMGLGKTVQSIAVLVERAALGPQLVVAPTSVVANWLDELARFAPSLDARVYRGAKRKAALSNLGPGAVLVTSYELLLRDRERFEGLVFATHVVDEAQVVKNARTLRARAVASISADFRIALTGTPVENRLADVWSLFHLIAPGLFGPWSRFRARFAVPIERYENEERAAALRALVAPFILRRTKDEVARELPERTEVVQLVELSPAEQELYDGAVREARRAIGKRKKHEGERTVQILAELTRLRQLACHPRLVVDDERVASSKLTALLQLFEDVLPRGHRVLVFSQFTRHLALVRDALSERGIRWLYLDGSTPVGQRKSLVERFQGGEAEVFLISLKAGGTGLNLTAADYVVHLDPWWNPAAADQASDRAHRLGQARPVTIVKLVSQGTIEEKVLSLHGHKRRLADAVLSGEKAPRELDADALEQLLAGA